MDGDSQPETYSLVPGDDGSPLPPARAVGAGPALDGLPVIAPLAPDLVGAPSELHHDAVRAALYRRAVGSVTWEEKLDKFGGTQVVRRDVPPDPAAARDWLRAHKPDEWGERKQVDVQVIVRRLGPGSERAGVTIEGEIENSLKIV